MLCLPAGVNETAEYNSGEWRWSSVPSIASLVQFSWGAQMLFCAGSFPKGKKKLFRTFFSHFPCDFFFHSLVIFVFFDFHILVNFSSFFLLLTSNVIALWLENRFCVFSIPLTVLSLFMAPHMVYPGKCSMCTWEERAPGPCCWAGCSVGTGEMLGRSVVHVYLLVNLLPMFCPSLKATYWSLQDIKTFL